VEVVEEVSEGAVGELDGHSSGSFGRGSAGCEPGSRGVEGVVEGGGTLRRSARGSAVDVSVVLAVVRGRSIFSVVGRTAFSAGMSAKAVERFSREAYHQTARLAATTRPETIIAPGHGPRGRADERSEEACRGVRGNCDGRAMVGELLGERPSGRRDRRCGATGDGLFLIGFQRCSSADHESSLGGDGVHMLIVFLRGDVVDELGLEAYAEDGSPRLADLAELGEESVVEARSAAEAAAFVVEGETGDEDEVDGLECGGMAADGLGDAMLPDFGVEGAPIDDEWSHGFGGPVHAGDAESFGVGGGAGGEFGEIDLFRDGEVEHEGGGGLVAGGFEDASAKVAGAENAFGLGEGFEAFAGLFPQGELLLSDGLGHGSFYRRRSV
jgi:hypothetical protein